MTKKFVRINGHSIFDVMTPDKRLTEYKFLVKLVNC